MGGRSESGFVVEAGAGEGGEAAGMFSGVVTTGGSGTLVLYICVCWLQGVLALKRGMDVIIV
jgi:hypothetical protein